MKGKVFRIKRFSVHDGPGIRTTIFLKGCAMRCAWCHNPEGLNEETEIWHDRSSCISCGRCVDACTMKALTLAKDEHKVQVTRELCRLNGDCVSACPTGSIDFTAKEMTTAEVVSEVEKDMVFFGTSGGGVTLSGGEPFFQPDFSASILNECKTRQIDTAVETSLFVNPQLLDRLINDTDLFIVDLKISDPEKHFELTGQPNGIILENFRYLASAGKNIIVRVPLVKNITDTPGNLESIQKFVTSVNKNIPVEHVKYNSLARNNYERLGIPFRI